MTETPNETPPPCCVCSNPIWPQPNGWAGGHNAWPVGDGRCCDTCNATVVIAARLEHYYPPDSEVG